MMPRFLIVALFSLFFGFSAAVQANTVDRIFPQADQVSRQSEKTLHYLLPLGRIKEDRQAGRVQPSRSQRLEGDLERYTWRLASDTALLDARTQIEAFLKEQNPERLFQCEARDCGDSVFWANNFFAESVLFGADRSQFLWVIKDRNTSRYHVLYLVERPNKRIYLHEDSLLVPAGMETAEQVALSLERSGRVRLGKLAINNDKVDFTALIEKVKLWQAENGKPVVLVLHRHGSFRQQPELIKQLRDALAKAGLQGKAEDVGALAPDPNAVGAVWVDWVNEDWAP